MYYVPEGTTRCGYYECESCGEKFLSLQTMEHINCCLLYTSFTGGGTKKVPDCEILGIELSRDDFDNKYDAALGNGITFGMTPDEVKAVMGEPTDSYTSDTSDYMTLTYEENDDAYASSVEFTFQDLSLIHI